MTSYCSYVTTIQVRSFACSLSRSGSAAARARVDQMTKPASSETANMKRAKSVAVPARAAVSTQRQQQHQTNTTSKALAPISSVAKKSTVVITGFFRINYVSIQKPIQHSQLFHYMYIIKVKVHMGRHLTATGNHMP